MSGRTRGIVEMTLAMVISGTIGWFVLFAGRPVLDVVFWRCVFGALALLIICAAARQLKFRLTQQQFGIAMIGGIAIVLNWLLLFGSYSHASISIATAIYNTQPFMLLVFGTLMFGERITAAKLGWLALAFAGLVLIVVQKPTASYVGNDYVLGVVMALAAAFGWAVGAVTTKRLTGVPPQLIALIHVATGTIMLAPFAEFSDLPSDPGTWSTLVTLGLVHTGLMYALLYSAVQRLPTYLQGALSFIYPVAAILVDVVALDHHLHFAQIAGVATILVAAGGMTLGSAILPRRSGERAAPAE
jgi:RarD protein